MLKTNKTRCIEKILKKGKKENNSVNSYDKIFIDNNTAIIINPHFCYIMDISKIEKVNKNFIASEKEKNLCKIISDKGYKKLLKDFSAAVDKITITYKQAQEMKKEIKINKWGGEYVRIECNEIVINIKLENLLDCFRIFQNEELTLNIYKTNFPSRRNWHDNKTNKLISCSPYIIESNNNYFVAAPYGPTDSYKKESAA